jgi:hypothetical protein
MTISEIMAQLSILDRERLMISFESGLPCYIEWTKGRFLGVYVDGIPNLVCLQESGLWREGTINVQV